MNKEKCFKVNAWTAYIGKFNIIVPTHSQTGNRCISVSWLTVCSCIHCTSKPRTQQLRLPTQILAPGGRNHPALPEGSITGRQLAWRVRLVYTSWLAWTAVIATTSRTPQSSSLRQNHTQESLADSCYNSYDCDYVWQYSDRWFWLFVIAAANGMYEWVSEFKRNRS